MYFGCCSTSGSFSPAATFRSSSTTPQNYKTRLQALVPTQGMRNFIQNSMSIQTAQKIYHQTTQNNWKLDPKNDDLLLEVLEKNCLESLRFLLNSGANPNAKNRVGKTALMLAGIKGNVQIIHFLIKARPNLEMCDLSGDRALMHIAKKGHVQAAQYLIEHRARIEASNHQGKTPLMIAAAHEQHEMVKALVALGANIEHQDAWGATPLAIEIEAGESPQMATLLRSLGANNRVANRMVENVFFAHAWGLEGRTCIVEKSDQFSYKLEGMRPKFALRKLLETFKRFCAFNTTADAISKEHQTEISKAVRYAETDRKLLTRMQAQKPVLILGGTENHSICIVACKDYTQGGHYKLGICNRGDGTQEPSTQAYTTQFYLLPQSAIHPTLIDQLTTNYATVELFYKMITDLKLICVGGYNQKLQKAGICSWASSKGGLGMLYVLCMSQKLGLKVYKSFTRESRKKTLKEHLDLEKVNQDRHILEQVKEKYYKKAELIFQKNLIDQLLKACEVEK